MKNEFKKHLDQKEADDLKDLKHITILLCIIGIALCAWCAYVLIAIP